MFQDACECLKVDAGIPEGVPRMCAERQGPESPRNIGTAEGSA